MREQFKDFPICINCKYYLAEKAGPLQIIQTCGLTMVDPVTGEFADRVSRVKLAAAYRKDSMPCGPSGKFFQPNAKKKAKPESKPVVVEVKKESTAKVIKVDVPELNDYRKDYTPLPDDDPDKIMLLEVEQSMHGVDKAKITKDNPILDVEPELLPKEPGQKRRRRDK